MNALSIYHFFSYICEYKNKQCKTYNPISIKYIKKADIDPAGLRFGPHSRRASAATSMVNSGVSYGSVKRILGHLDPNAVKHYAALDREHLRNCALPAPPPKGLLKDLLEGKSSL